MRMLSRTVASLAMALTAGASLVGAQTPVVPEPPIPLTSIFTEIRGQYGFGGCVEGIVELSFDHGPIHGTAYCVSGVVIVGTAPWIFPGSQRLTATLAFRVTAADPRVQGVFVDLSSGQYVSGIVTDETCPLGCSRSIGFTLGTTSSPSGQLSYTHAFTQFLSLDPNSVFDARTSGALVAYRPLGFNDVLPYTGFIGNEVFALTAVPEPSTYALFGTGLLALGGIASRRRRTR